MRTVSMIIVMVALAGCAGFRKDATPEERAASAGTVETVTTALGDALPWPWNQIAFGVGALGLGYLGGRRGVRVAVTSAPAAPK